MFPPAFVLSVLIFICRGFTSGAFTFGPVPEVYFLFFHQVSLEYEGKQVCGGSIVSPRHIVTAVECVKGKSANLLAVRVAFLNDPNGGKIHAAENFTIHEEYKKIQYGIPVNDIAVVRVKVPFEKTRLSEPIQLFNKNDTRIEDGTLAYVNTWGETTNNSTTPELQIWSIQIMANDTCNRDLKYFGGILADKICTPVGSKGLCRGDEGSALTIGRRLAGIVSWTGRHCGDHFPGVYTKIADYSDWISEKIKY